MEKEVIFYQILSVSVNATASKIKKSYHTLARKWHPDKNPSPDAEKRMKELNSAYETLIDPKKRK